MSIDSLRSGAIRICFDPSLNAYPSKCRILLEGQMFDTGTAVSGELIKIASPKDVDLLFGGGSVIAEGLKTGFLCCSNQAMEFFALPWKDADVGATTAARYELLFTGPATSDGRIDLFMADGRWNTSTRVLEGMTADEIAAAVMGSIINESGFPYDAQTGTGGALTLTAMNSGSVGNGLNPIYNWHQRRDYAPVGVEMTVSQVDVGANTAAPLPDYAAILGECCYCCIGMLYDDKVRQDAMIEYIASAWSCLKPQCFGHGYTYNTGTLGQILASDTNSAEVCRLAHCDSDPNLGWLKVAGFTTLSCCSTVDNPEMSIQGPNFGVLSCVKLPEFLFPMLHV